MRIASLLIGLAFLSAVLIAGCQTNPPAAPTHQTTLAPIDLAGIHNARRVTDKVIAGAQPEGEESFRALRDLGVKTIISVDGATPDVDGAAKFGLRYVHLPIEYSGVTDEQGRMIGKAIAELPGPIYIHCHHGKHRSAAAVAVACVYNGSLEPSHAEEVLKTFGTGENYKGLWKAARDAKPVDPAELNRTEVKYVAAAKIGPLAESMVKLDQRWDSLKLIQKNNWKTPPDHPDLDPPHEALLVEELLKELNRTGETAAKGADFLNLLKKSTTAATTLRESLTDNDLLKANAAAKSLAATCTECHRTYRD